jgi:hypothetical protein
MKECSGLSYKELRNKALSDEIIHEQMNILDYERLLDNEAALDNPDAVVVETAITGLKCFDKYKDLDDIMIFTATLEKLVKWDSAVEERSESFVESLRNQILSGELTHSGMNVSVYEYILDNEVLLDEPSAEVIEFCTDGLTKCDEYEGLEPIEIYINAMSRQSETAESSISIVKAKRVKPLKRVFVAAVAVIVTLLVITLTAAAFGYNVIDLIREAFKSPDNAVIDSDGRLVFSLDDINFYESINEMLESEEVNILFPTQLSVGYEFIDFRVADNGGLEIRAYSSEPYLDFRVEIDTNQVDPGSYTHEINNIEYSVFERDDRLYQAWWFYGSDYYTIVADNESVLSEIIENLKEY